MKIECVEVEEVILEYGLFVVDYFFIVRSVLRLGFVFFNVLICEYLKVKVLKYNI